MTADPSRGPEAVSRASWAGFQGADGATRTVPLTRGLEAVVDAADYARVAPYTWSALQGRDKRWYAVRVVQVNKRQQMIYMHRFILGLSREDPQVDHKDRDGLNNTRENLRLATYKQNAANTDRRPGVSGYRGVWRKRDRWSGRVGNTSIGVYDTAEEAARAYDARALERWGEFATLNFPQ